MKKSLLALAVLASAAGAAQAASSVTLYGRVDVGYEKWSGSSLTQEGGNESRLGIKGQEDLGNGLAATFQLEGRFNADVGGWDAGRAMFDRESTVGLKGNFGHVRFGRSKSAMERGLGDFNVGERVAGTDPYRSMTRHSNAMFYDYSVGGFSAGFDVTTKGGAVGTEGASGAKVSYGLFAGYKANNFAVGAAYQADRDQSAFGVDREWGVAASYTFNPVTIGLTYADARDNVTPKTKQRTWGAYVTADITANDNVYVKFQRNTNKTALTSVFPTTDYADVANYKSNIYALGYSHAFSKRTSIYADVARVTTKYNNIVGYKEKATGYNIALRHAF